MRVLIDTHCWLWALSDPSRLGSAARELLEDGENEIVFSAVSAWEIAIKTGLGKLKLPEPVSGFVAARLAEYRMVPLPIYHTHALHVTTLPPLHRDPFDRLLIAQSQIEKLPLLTADPQLLPYGLEIVWAGRRRQPSRRKTR